MVGSYEAECTIAGLRRRELQDRAAAERRASTAVAEPTIRGIVTAARNALVLAASARRWAIATAAPQRADAAPFPSDLTARGAWRRS